MSEPPPNYKEGQQSGVADKQAGPQVGIGLAVGKLTGELAAFRDQLQADSQGERIYRKKHDAKQLCWTKIAAVGNLALSALVLTVLYMTLGAYRETNKIAAINLAPRVTVKPNWPRGGPNISFVVTNEGRSSAYNVVIAANTVWRTSAPNVDPCKSAGATKPQLQTVDELLPNGTAGSYVVNWPSKGENLYFYGVYSYESRLPEIPKTVQKFCYLARDDGTVETYGTFHVLSMHGSISVKAGVSGVAQASSPAPTATP